MDVLGIGIDTVEVKRIKRLVERYNRFLRKIYSEDEISYCNRKRGKYQSLAGRFASKEALFKALGTGWKKGVSFRDVVVCNMPSGKPEMTLRGKTKEIASSLGVNGIHLSITHTEEYAIAVVILLRD